MLAGYASVENGCRKAVVIKSVTSDDFGMVMIHETVVENGISKMRHLDALTVPAKGSASFAPAGRHLMLMAPVRELKPGDKVSLKFVLADGKVILAEFALRRAMPAAEK